MYYGMTGTNCTSGPPRPLYFQDGPPVPDCGSNDDYCESFNVRNDKSGCKKGYKDDDPVPPPHVLGENPQVTTGTFPFEGGTIKLKLYKYNPRLPRPWAGTLVGVGYEPKPIDISEFPDRPQELFRDNEHCCHIDIGNLRYHVILNHGH
jgi:hypothetical protein